MIHREGRGNLWALIQAYLDSQGGMSANALARKIDSSGQTVSSWKTRGSRPEAETLRKLAAAIDCPYEVALAATEADTGYRTDGELAAIMLADQEAGCSCGMADLGAPGHDEGKPFDLNYEHDSALRHNQARKDAILADVESSTIDPEDHDYRGDGTDRCVICLGTMNEHVSWEKP